MGPTHAHAGGYPVAFGDHILDRDVHVGKGGMCISGELSEGLDEPQLSVFFGYACAFVVRCIGVDDLLRPVEVPRGDYLVDLPRDDLVLLRHGAFSTFPTIHHWSRHLTRTYAELALRLQSCIRPPSLIHPSGSWPLPGHPEAMKMTRLFSHQLPIAPRATTM